VLGFIPGVLVSLVMYRGLAAYTGLLMMLTVSRAAWILLLTAIMCLVSGCLAMRKVLSPNPAELF